MSEDSIAQVAADPYAEQRAALVASLRELADFYEQHTTVVPERWPDFHHSVAHTGNPVRDDEDGVARVHAIAELLGEEPYTNANQEHVKHYFGVLEFDAYYIRNGVPS